MNDDNVIDTTDTHDVDQNFELAQGIVKDLVDNNPSAAMDKMNDTMLDRVRDAIAGKRQEVAQNLLGTEPQQDEARRGWRDPADRCDCRRYHGAEQRARLPVPGPAVRLRLKGRVPAGHSGLRPGPRRPARRPCPPGTPRPAPMSPPAHSARPPGP